jgi:hypothetical protein
MAVAAQLHVKADEIHDFMADQPVGKISGDAAEDEPERNLADERVRIEMMPREKQRDEREQADERERAVVAAEQTPRRAGVAPMDEFKKSGDDDALLVNAKRTQHEPFCKLVERKNGEREQRNAEI